MIAALALSLVCSGTPCQVSLPGVAPIPSPHVRFQNSRIAEVMQFAGKRSSTFRQLVSAIEAAQGVAYIEEGRCMNGAFRSCVHPVAGARIVMVYVNPRQDVLSVARALAHELQHAVEILTSDRNATDAPDVEALYSRIGQANCPTRAAECWETRAAQDTERQVVFEICHARSTREVDR
jgi:hypothetical protein